MLEVNNLNKTYHIPSNKLFSKKSINVLNNISFKLNKNETLGIIGESGSGKSTLAKILIELIKPSSGFFKYTDKDITYLSNDINKTQKKKSIIYKNKKTMVFQETYNSLNPKKIIYDILLEPLLIHLQNNKIKQNKDILKKKAIEVIQSVGLTEDILMRYPNEFSGGQRQRIGIARALIIQPQIIILDEPVSSLDVSIQAQILNLLINLKNKYNLSFIFIGHDLSIVKYMADKIIVLYKGNLVEQQETEKLFLAPKSEYTKKMIIDAKYLEMGIK